MSRLSSIRAPTESSTDLAEAGVTCIRPPRTRLIALPAARGNGLDPRDRRKELEHLPETRQHADDKDDTDRAVEIGRRQEYRLDHRPDQHGTRDDAGQNDQHQNDLTRRSGDAHCLCAFCPARHGLTRSCFYDGCSLTARHVEANGPVWLRPQLPAVNARTREASQSRSVSARPNSARCAAVL